jgi:hypothetical protein
VGDQHGRLAAARRRLQRNGRVHRLRLLTSVALAAFAIASSAEAAPELVLPAPSPSLPSCAPTVEQHDIHGAPRSGQLLISPPSIETNLPKGGRARGCIVLENRSRNELRLTFAPVDAVSPSTPDEGPTFGGSSPWGAGAWITPKISSLTLPATTLVSVPFSVLVPHDADPGSHEGAILVTATASEAQAVAIQTGLVSQIGIVVEGKVIRDGSLEHGDGPRFVHGGGDAIWTSTWANTGNVSDHISATLDVRNSFTGKLVSRTAFRKGRVLRGSARAVKLAWRDAPWFGRYRATMRVTTDAGTHVVRYGAVWAVPPTWFLLLALFAVALPFVGWWVRRRRALQEAYVAELVQLELQAARDDDS